MAYIFFKSSSQPFFVICTRFIRLMVPTSLIPAVKPNTLKSTQRALRELRFTAVEHTKTVITKQKMMSVKSTD